MSRESQKGSFLEAISPWNISRSTKAQSSTDEQDVLRRCQGEDHTITHRHRISLQQYPPDCPPLKVRWFYAVDSPKRKPLLSERQKDETKPLPPPKKFIPFTSKDSQDIESAFQKLCDLEIEEEQAWKNETTRKFQSISVTVPVNEDYLFDVNIGQRELTPTYWIGPVYEVRRGTWFVQEGSSFKPCEENLATQLEEGYLKLKPWRLTKSQSATFQTTLASKSHDGDHLRSEDRSSRSKSANQHASRPEVDQTVLTNSISGEPRNYRLFGAYMNNIVTYQDSSTALLTSDDFMTRMSTTVYQKLGGVAGTRVVRGFVEPKNMKDATPAVKPQELDSNPALSSAAPDIAELRPESSSSNAIRNHGSKIEEVIGDEPRLTLERQMSSLAGEPRSTAELEEQARRQEEKEMEYSGEANNEDREREIDHLVLVTHGIGQRLGLRLESINFIHDINVLRKTMKSVYKASPDLQALNSAFPDSRTNCRVQVLPVCWRHRLDFPHKGIKQSRNELDLTDADVHEEDVYPGLNDITLDSVPAVRNLISDLAMDVLLYQSAYSDPISTIVKEECNRILHLFKERNPSFRGSVSLCGHSLGSAILFDILCHQQSGSSREQSSVSEKARSTRQLSQDCSLDFECEELFCLGSPIGLFQMIKGNTIAGRSITQSRIFEGAQEDGNDQGFSTTSPGSHGTSTHARVVAFGERSTIVSSPNCRQLYNIFHPSDPVSYRIEPLISPAMSSLKPQPLPSVKKSLWAAPGQSLTMIGNRVGQSVGSLWSNFTTGVASSLLNRSLGLSSDEASAESANTTAQGLQPRKSPGISLIGETSSLPQSTGESTQKGNAKHRTLIESNLETLYEGYQNPGGGQDYRAAPAQDGDYSKSRGSDNRLKRLKVEDAKVRALNSNGRVDYSIQEGAFDISLIASIASHLTYWADEDVNHFILSQMLSRNGRKRSTRP